MTRYDYIQNAYRIFINGLSDAQRKILTENPALESELYTTFVGFVECMLSGVRWYNTFTDELTDEEVSREVLSYADALRIKVQTNTGLIYIKQSVYENTIKFLKENGTDVKSYLEYMEAQNV